MKSHTFATNALARVERHALQTTHMKRDCDRDLKLCKQHTQAEVHVTRECVLPNIEHNGYRRETPIDSQKDCNQPCEDMIDLQPHNQHTQ